MTTVKGPAIFLAQFMGDSEPIQQFEINLSMGEKSWICRCANSHMGCSMYRSAKSSGK